MREDSDVDAKGTAAEAWFLQDGYDPKALADVFSFGD